MKRTLLALLSIGLLAACAGLGTPAAAKKSESPTQSLAATGRAMSALRSVRFEASGTVTLTLPQAAVDQLQSRAGAMAALLAPSTTVTFKVSGAAQRPDQLDAQVHATIGRLTIDTELISTGGATYYRDPLSGRWEKLEAAGLKGSSEKSGSRTSGLSYQTVLDTARSVTEVSDSSPTLNGVAVDHYRVVPDLARLFAQASAAHPDHNQQAAAAIEAALEQAKVTLDLWTGTADGLVHRLSYDLDASADLHDLQAARAGKAQDHGPVLPAGSTAHVTAHVVVDLHDFNATVKIQAPATAT